MIHLRGEHTDVVIDESFGVPVVVHWGAPLGEVDPVTIGRALARSLVPGALDVVAPISVVPEHGAGFQGRPGLSGHRQGGTAGAQVSAPCSAFGRQRRRGGGRRCRRRAAPGVHHHARRGAHRAADARQREQQPLPARQPAAHLAHPCARGRTAHLRRAVDARVPPCAPRVGQRGVGLGEPGRPHLARAHAVGVRGHAGVRRVARRGVGSARCMERQPHVVRRMHARWPPVRAGRRAAAPR